MAVKKKVKDLMELPWKLLDTLIERIRVPAKKTFIMKPPRNLNIFDMLDKGLQKQLGESEADNIKLQHEIERIKGEKRDEYKEINELAKEHFKKQRDEEKIRTLNLELKGTNYPTWFLKNDNIYKKLYLKGFRLYQTRKGYLLWFPWFVNTEGKSFIPTKGAPTFTQLFKSDGIVTQIKGGKFDSNYMYDGFDLFLIPDKGVDAESGEAVNIIHLDSQERQEYEYKIERLKEQLSGLYTHLQQSKEKEIAYQKEIHDSRLIADTESKRAESYQGGLGIMAEKSASMSDNLVTALTTVQDAKMDQLLAENALTHLKETINGLNKDLSFALRDVDSVMRKKVEEKIKDSLNVIEKMMSSSQPPQGGGGNE